MKKLSLLAIVALLGVGLSVCVAGEVAISVLDIDAGVRALGMGGAAVALADDTETLYYNAAGLSEVDGINFGSFLASHMGVATYSALDLTFSNFGLGFIMFNSGNISGYDGDGSPTETLSYGSSAVLFGFGVRPKDFIPALPLDFSLGGRIKYLSVTGVETNGSGFAFDLAYNMGFAELSLGPIALSDVALGATVTNLFGSMSYGDYSESCRMNLRVGGATQIAGVVLLAADFEFSGGFHIGVEYRPIDTFAIRAGVLNQGGGVSFTLGLGIGIEGLALDYAYVTHSTLEGSHRVSLTIDFSGLDLGGITSSLGRILP